MVKFNNNTMIIFGGWGSQSDLVDQNIFHVITINNDGTRKKTSQKITELNTDTHNYYKTIIIDNSLYIHVNVSNTVPDRIFKITFNGDPHDFDYTVKTYSIDSNHIPRRYSHGFFYIDNDFYLFGGYPNSYLSNDLYRINLNDDETYTYSKLELDDTSDYITPRYLFGISKINNNIYILGGKANKNSDDPEPEEGYINDRFSNEIFKLTINNNTYHSTLIRYNGYKQDLKMQEPHCLTLNNDIFIIGYNKDYNTLYHNYYNYLNNKIYKLTINPDTDELTVKILIDNMYESIGYHVRYITFVNINNNIYGYLQSMTDTSYLDKRFIKIEINNSLGTINVKDNTDIIFNINNTLDFDTSNNSTIINYKTFIFDVSADGMNAYTFNEVKDRRNTISGNNPDITIYTGDTCIFNNISDGHIIAIKDSNEQVIETEINKSLTYKFTEIGIYTYYCTAGHQSMIEILELNKIKIF